MAKKKKGQKPVVVNASFEQLVKESVSGNPASKDLEIIREKIRLSVAEYYIDGMPVDSTIEGVIGIVQNKSPELTADQIKNTLSAMKGYSITDGLKGTIHISAEFLD